MFNWPVKGLEEMAERTVAKYAPKNLLITALNSLSICRYPQRYPQMGAATPLRGWVTPELRVGEFLHHLKYRVHNIGNVVGQFLSFSHGCIASFGKEPGSTALNQQGSH